MNTKDFLRLGVPPGESTRRATDFGAKFILGGGDKSRLHEEVVAIVANPSAFLADDLRKEFAKALLNAPPPPRSEPVEYHQWGEGLDDKAWSQLGTIGNRSTRGARPRMQIYHQIRYVGDHREIRKGAANE